MTTREQLIASGVIKASRLENQKTTTYKKVVAVRKTKDFASKTDKAMSILREAMYRNTRGAAHVRG